MVQETGQETLPGGMEPVLEDIVGVRAVMTSRTSLILKARFSPFTTECCKIKFRAKCTSLCLARKPWNLFLLESQLSDFMMGFGRESLPAACPGMQCQCTLLA